MYTIIVHCGNDFQHYNFVLRKKVLEREMPYKYARIRREFITKLPFAFPSALCIRHSVFFYCNNIAFRWYILYFSTFVAVVQIFFMCFQSSKYGTTARAKHKRGRKTNSFIVLLCKRKHQTVVIFFYSFFFLSCCCCSSIHSFLFLLWVQSLAVSLSACSPATAKN